MPAKSGQTTVTTAGSEVPLGAVQVNGPLAVRALASNSGVIYLGNDGNHQVSSTSGFQLSAGDTIIFDFVGNLASILVDASVNGEGVCWLCLDF